MSLVIHCSYDQALPSVWRTTREYARATSIGVVAIEEGFLTDGASIPKVVHGMMGPWGAYFPAALIHDALYAARPEGVSREDADRVFLELMLRDRVDRQQAVMMHAAVRAFGQLAWDSPEDPEQAALVSVISVAQGDLT